MKYTSSRSGRGYRLCIYTPAHVRVLVTLLRTTKILGNIIDTMPVKKHSCKKRSIPEDIEATMSGEDRDNNNGNNDTRKNSDGDCTSASATTENEVLSQDKRSTDQMNDQHQDDKENKPPPAQEHEDVSRDPDSTSKSEDASRDTENKEPESEDDRPSQNLRTDSKATTESASATTGTATTESSDATSGVLAESENEPRQEIARKLCSVCSHNHL